MLRALGLGDLLTAVPALRALRRSHPDHRFVLAAPRTQEPLLARIDGPDSIIHTPGLVPLQAPPGPLDLAVNLHGKGPQSTDLLAALCPRRLLAFDRPSPFGPTVRWSADEHEVDRWCRLVDAAGALADTHDLRLRPAPGLPVPKSGVVVHPGAASAARRWPASRFGRLVAALRRRGLPVTVSGGPNEAALVREVLTAAGRDGAGCTPHLGHDLASLSTLVETSELVIVGDTGVAHLATALGTRSVVLFGPTSPEQWGPRNHNTHRVLWSGTTGDPHGNQPDEGLMRICVADVVSAAEQMLSATT